MVRAAGFDASPGYDESVYYSASASLLHGRIPYHDFVLLHPPVGILALLPAALLGHWTSDRTGYAAANAGFSVIGALNAVLVFVVARKLGLGRRASTIGGLLYAVWFATVNAEHSARLEPLGNFFLLLALLALVTGLEESRTRRKAVLAVLTGVLLGTATSVKIWGIVPLVVVIGWVLVARRQRRDAGLIALGAVAAGVLLDVPFLIASRGEMWTMVVNAQLSRQSSGYAYVVRLADIGSAYWPRPEHGVTPGIVVSAVFGIVVLAFVVGCAWRVPSTRPIVVLAAATLLTLLVTPAWFQPYSDFAAGPVAICAAATAESLRGRLRAVGWLPTGAAAAVTLAIVVQGVYPATLWWGPDAMITAARHVRCVTSDTPAGLIALDVLDRDLHNGCEVWVDPAGRGYLDSHQAGGALKASQIWQREVVRYLRTGQLAYPYMRRHPLDAHSRAIIRRGGVALEVRAEGRRFVLYYVRRGPAR